MPSGFLGGIRITNSEASLGDCHAIASVPKRVAFRREIGNALGRCQAASGVCNALVLVHRIVMGLLVPRAACPVTGCALHKCGFGAPIANLKLATVRCFHILPFHCARCTLYDWHLFVFECRGGESARYAASCLRAAAQTYHAGPVTQNIGKGVMRA